jgi:hypothetical protein
MLGMERMTMEKPQVFKDKNGTAIKAGDVLLRRFFARWRERPGHKRVAVEGMSGREVIVSDEGGLKEAQEHWVQYLVKWSGACLIAERGECSDFQALMQAVLFDDNGKQIHEGSGFHYMNNAFNSSVYEVMPNAKVSGAGTASAGLPGSAATTGGNDDNVGR